ncbi:ELMO domain-containing protein 1 isoform X4 [Mobula hypostoma]|uniref:ELMO domain-containing protein 1 isoform X4 n=1 Tax=Mobula hypostoma TaxID=723540 RepID=UPI002FC35643
MCESPSHPSFLDFMERMLVQLCWYFYCTCLWRFLKFALRKITGKCELQRICYSRKPGAQRTLKIESSLKSSRNEVLQSAVFAQMDDIEKTVDNIMQLKKINPDTNPQFGISLQACLLQIVGYTRLIAEVEKLRKDQYDSENPHHEEMLMKLWTFLRPDVTLDGRISKQWCEIGFQGDDPKTDFRGMGMLGLYNLVFFAEHDNVTARRVLFDSHQPKYSGSLKTHLYNVAPESPSLFHFHKVFCYLMHEFHKFWVEEDPLDIMEFNRVREKFHKRIIKQLQNPDMTLCPHFAASESLMNL